MPLIHGDTILADFITEVSKKLAIWRVMMIITIQSFYPLATKVDSWS